MGAALSVILEEKMELGLAVPPPERIPVKSLGEKELLQQALDDRAERGRVEKMRLRTTNKKAPWNRLHNHDRRLQKVPPSRAAQRRTRGLVRLVPRHRDLHTHPPVEPIGSLLACGQIGSIR